MGQRANYIIKSQDKLTIHYNHWRATCIAADLYLGEKRFLQFVEECELSEEIMNETWIEGCVVIEKLAKQLYFWTREFSNETSVIEYYQSALEKKWNGWSIRFLHNSMYDVEKLLNLDYISKQKLPDLNRWSKESIVNDKPDEWTTALVVIKNENGLFVTKTGNLNIEIIVSYGQGIIPLLKDKPEYQLPIEEDEASYECIIIDSSTKKLIINESAFGLWEQCKDLWEGYDFTMGDYGYIEALHLAGIDTTKLKMTQDRVLEHFNNIVNHESNFDPFEMAEKLTRENSNIQFNPDFYNIVKPQKTIVEKLKIRLRKIFSNYQ